MKMYILVRDSIPLGHQVNCVGHASIVCFVEFKNDPDLQDWWVYSFRKVTCEVTDEQFEKAKEFEKHVVVKESDLDGVEVAIAFCPREKYNEWFKSLKLFGAKDAD